MHLVPPVLCVHLVVCCKCCLGAYICFCELCLPQCPCCSTAAGLAAGAVLFAVAWPGLEMDADSSTAVRQGRLRGWVAVAAAGPAGGVGGYGRRQCNR